MLSTGEQILGWEIAIPTMKKGEKSRFLIKSEYAYGNIFPVRFFLFSDVFLFQMAFSYQCQEALLNSFFPVRFRGVLFHIFIAFPYPAFRHQRKSSSEHVFVQ